MRLTQSKGGVWLIFHTKTGRKPSFSLAAYWEVTVECLGTFELLTRLVIDTV